jgi:hypothetical protein
MLAESPNGSASSIGSYGSKRWFMLLNDWPPSFGARVAGLANGGFCAGGIGGGMLFAGGKLWCGKGPGPAD